MQGGLLLLACSGEGASAAIAAAQTIGMFSFLAGLTVVGGYVISMARHGPFRPVLPLVLFASCPFFWISAIHGDCGMLLRMASEVWLVVVSASIGIAAYRRRGSLAPRPR